MSNKWRKGLTLGVTRTASYVNSPGVGFNCCVYFPGYSGTLLPQVVSQQVFIEAENPSEPTDTLLWSIGCLVSLDIFKGWHSAPHSVEKDRSGGHPCLLDIQSEIERFFLTPGSTNYGWTMLPILTSPFRSGTQGHDKIQTSCLDRDLLRFPSNLLFSMSSPPLPAFISGSLTQTSKHPGSLFLLWEYSCYFHRWVFLSGAMWDSNIAPEVSNEMSFSPHIDPFISLCFFMEPINPEMTFNIYLIFI